MQFGTMVVPRASDWRIILDLERMGYDSVWIGFSDDLLRYVCNTGVGDIKYVAY